MAYTLRIGGVKAEFKTKAEYDRYKYLLDLFEPSVSTGKVPHTNMEPSVLMSEDNPLLKNGVTLVDSGIAVQIEEISDKDWEDKYEGQGSGYVKKVQAVDPHGSQFKAKQKKVKKKSEPMIKTWVGAPYTDEELQPQNLRYISSSNNVDPCDICIPGVPTMQVGVTSCNGGGQGWFPCAVFNGATPTNALIGQTVECAPSGSPFYYPCQGPCLGGPWLVNQIIPCQVGWSQCESLVPGAPCAGSPSTCATPHQPMSSPAQSVVDFEGTQSVQETNGNIFTRPGSTPVSTNAGLEFDLTRYPPNAPPPEVWDCSDVFLGIKYTDSNTNANQYPFNMFHPNLLFWRTNWQFHYYSMTSPNTNIRGWKFTDHTPSIYPNACTEMWNGAPWALRRISKFSPGPMGMDPATGQLPVGWVTSSMSVWDVNGNIQPAGHWYDTWTEMMDDLIAAGEYVGSNTDTWEDLYNQGMGYLWYLSHYCSAPCGTVVTSNCATPHQP